MKRKSSLKLSSILLTVALILSTVAATASMAATTRGTGTFSVTAVNAKQGGSVKVPIVISANDDSEGVAAAICDVTFDTKALAVTDIKATEAGTTGAEADSAYAVEYKTTDGTNISVDIDATGKGTMRLIAYVKGEAEPALKTITAYVTFNVLETAVVGETVIDFSMGQACDYGTVDIISGNFSNDEALIDMTTVAGAVTVESATTEPVYDSSVKIVGKNGLFESDYSLLFYVPTTLPDGWYIEATMAKYNKNTRLEDVTKTLTIDDLYDTTTISGNTYYRVALKGIAAKEVANEITVTLHKVVDGVDYYGDSIQYNLVSYATARIAKKNEKEVAAMAAFLNYASAAQTRFGYNTNNLANASLTDEQKVVTPVSEITDATRDNNYIVIDNPTATLNGFAPSYEDKMTLVTYCKVPDNYVEAGLKIKYEYTSGSVNKVEYISLSESTAYNTIYRQVAFTGLAIKEVRTPVLVTVVDSNNNPISNTRRYSFEVYAASRPTTSDDYAPARAMVAFGDLFKVFKEQP